MSHDLVIGIDQSTSATKAIAWDREGRLVAEGRAAVPMANPAVGWFEQDPQDWWHSTVTALRGVTGQIDPTRIAALAISNQRETYAYFDAAGAALRPGTVWLDSRAIPQVARLDKSHRDIIDHVSGKPPEATPCLYRFAWFAENMPDIQSRAAKASEVHGFLTFKLTGEWVTSTASADPMGLLDLHSKSWSAEMVKLAQFDIARLPRLTRPGEPMGVVSAAAAALTGLKAGTPVIAGGGDGQCAGTGVDVLEPGRIYINMGTAVVSGLYAPSFGQRHRAFRTLTAIAEDGYIFENCLRAGTFVVDWLVREVMKIDPRAEPGIFKQLEAEAAQSPIGARGLVMVPYLAGCMTPYWSSTARGVFAGMTGSHKRGDIYRAMLEGLALEQAMITEQTIAASGRPATHFVAIGGGSSSDLWCQMLADATGLPVRRSTTVEASSLGAAVAAAAGAKWYDSIGAAAKAMAGQLADTIAPDAGRHARYRELGDLYRELWPRIASWNDRLAAFAESNAS